MRRVFAVDVLLCRRCGGRRRLVAVYPSGAARSPDRLGLSPTPGPPAAPGIPCAETRPRDIRLHYQTQGRPALPRPLPGHASAGPRRSPWTPGRCSPASAPARPGRRARPGPPGRLRSRAPPAEPPAHAAGPEGTEVKVGRKTSTSALEFLSARFARSCGSVARPSPRRRRPAARGARHAGSARRRPCRTKASAATREPSRAATASRKVFGT